MAFFEIKNLTVKTLFLNISSSILDMNHQIKKKVFTESQTSSKLPQSTLSSTFIKIIKRKMIEEQSSSTKNEHMKTQLLES